MRTTEKDILMICKGHYNKEIHKNLDEAMDAYYRKHYLVPKEQLPVLTHKFIYSLWLKECIRVFLTPEKKGEFLRCVVIEESWHEKDFLGKNLYGDPPVTDFYDVMYYRVVSWLSGMQVRDEKGNWIIDLSDYENIEHII